MVGSTRRQHAFTARSLFAGRGLRRAAALATIFLLAHPQLSHAEQKVQGALRERSRIQRKIELIERVGTKHIRELTWRIHRIQRARQALSSPAVLGGARWFAAHRHMRESQNGLEKHLRTYRRFTWQRIVRLRQQTRKLGDWLGVWRVFRRCPVDGTVDIADNFGVMVRIPGVPVHVHQGNDMMAATGTPIVAPFNGYASVSQSELGGLSVRVTGIKGYVYNAHLSALGTLGEVHAGQVVGYVGSTGDATAPHDHFEWHPGGGSAVDPNPFLSVVC